MTTTRAVHNNGADTPKAAVRESSQEISDLLNDLRELISNQSFSNQPEFSKLRQRLEESVASLRESAAAVARESGRQVREVTRRADVYAHDEPWKLAGMALAAGTVLGFLIARR